MTDQTQSGGPNSAGVVRRFIQIIVMTLLWGGLLFGGAGTLRWPMGWAFIGLYIGGILLNAIGMDPDLIAERGKRHTDAPMWDRWLATLGISVGYVALIFVSGLNQRFGWEPPLPAWVQGIGVAGFILSSALSFWAMHSNRYFSSLVRIQTDRDHSVQSGGPYAYIRHPGYAAFIIGCIATPLMLNAPWAMVPGLFASAAFILRTALEDRFLIEKLPGYRTYTEQTRYRLLPLVW